MRLVRVSLTLSWFLLAGVTANGVAKMPPPVALTQCFVLAFAGLVLLWVIHTARRVG
jgi:hypothetical protein